MRGSWAARWKSASELVPMPGAMTPPRKSPFFADGEDDQQAAVLLVGADDIDAPVRADGARVLVVEADARLDAGPDDQRAQVEIALAHLDEWHDERRHDR